MKRVKDFRSIKDILNISQISFQNKLITIIGEAHGYRENINKKDFNYISVCDFVDEKIKLNKNIKVCLEWDLVYGEPFNTSSHNINEIYLKLYLNNLLSNLYFFDKRGYYVNKTHINDLLYYRRRDLFSYNLDGIVKMFVDPYFQKHHYFDILCKSSYNNKNFKYLKKFLNNLDESFRWIGSTLQEFIYKNKILNDEDKISIINKLSNAWLRVCDYYLLTEILKNDSNEFIILIGDLHRKHLIEDIFKKELIFESNNSLNNIYELDIKKKKNKSLTLTKSKYINSKISSPKSKVIKSLRKKIKSLKSKKSKSKKIKTY